MERPFQSFCKYLLILLLSSISIPGLCQAQSVNKGLERFPVLTQSFSDSELDGYQLSSMVLKVAAGLTDTVAHRHDAELFGYVLQGRVEIKLEDTPLKIFNEGEMFYEPKNILHTMLRNRSGNEAAKILILYVIKKGRSIYIPEYQ